MAKNSPAASGLPAQIRELQAQVARLSAQVPRQEAQQSRYERTARGVLARQTLTANSSAFTSPSNSDFVLSGIVIPDETRIYTVHFKAQLAVSAVSQWNVLLTADDGGGAQGVDRLWRAPTDAGQSYLCAASVPWLPAAGTYTLRVRQALNAGTGTLTYSANAATDDTANRRSLWVEDSGLRPS